MKLFKMKFYFLILALCLVQACLSLKSSKKVAKIEENLKCTEFKDTIDSSLILHVPCILMRIVEQLKQCQIDTFQNSFLGKVDKPHK